MALFHQIDAGRIEPLEIIGSNQTIALVSVDKRLAKSESTAPCDGLQLCKSSPTLHLHPNSVILMSTAAGKRRRQEKQPARPGDGLDDSDDGNAAPAQKRPRPPSQADGDAQDAASVDDDVAATAAVARDALERVQAPSTMSKKRAAFLAKFPGKTPEQILDAVSDKWWSTVYDHFKPPRVVLAVKAGGPVLHRFVCKTHPSVWVDRADYEVSTGNLVRHVSKCEPQETPEKEAITAFAQGSTYSPARMRYYIALWCARHHRPFVIVDDNEFRALLRMLYGRVEIPSRVTVSRDIQAIMRFCKGLVIALFEAYPGRIHICVDGWTSPNILAFLGITAHWHHEGEVLHIILDFVRLTNAHTGSYLAEKLIECLRSFGIEEKLLSVTCDNAENNSTMLKEMHTLVPVFRGTSVRVRCFAHVLNLVVKGILSQFGKRLIENNGDDDRDDKDAGNEDDAEAAEEADGAREAADDVIIEALDLEDLQIELTAADIKMPTDALNKILKLSRKVWNSPTIRAELSKLATEADLNSDVLVRCVKTRWNSVTEVLARALEMRTVLTDLCDMVQFNKARGARLRQYILSDEEWTAIAQIYALLDPFLYATKQISASGRALVHQVIPYIDVLTTHVDTFKKDENILPGLRAASQRGRLILDKYYSLTDDSIVYRIAMILHPRYKIQYFKDQDWQEEWIAAAIEITRTEWETYYKPGSRDRDTPPASDDTQANIDHPNGRTSVSRTGSASTATNARTGSSADTNARAGPSSANANAHAGPSSATATATARAGSSANATARTGSSSARRSAQASARLPATSALFEGISKRRAPQDELEVYLQEPPLSTVDDPLAYWNLRIKTASSESPLAQMAIDFLTAQATSTDSERGFSRGRLTVSRLRHSLGEESVRSGTVLGSWSNVPGLVPEADVVQLLAARHGGAQPAAAAAAAAAPAAAAAAAPAPAAPHEVIEVD
ncbi:hypothetical protein VTO73DRAFT_15573 [Trametes versicolor]